MKFRHTILSACALLTLASCASPTPTKTTASVEPTPAPTPERATFRKDVVIHSQPEGAAIYINNVSFGYAPVTASCLAYVDTGEFVDQYRLITAVPTAPGQFTQQQTFTFDSNTTNCTVYMYNTAR
jgi:hypothetical protein